MTKITEWRGVESLVYAQVLQDTADTYETGEVKSLAGVSEISKTTESSSEAHYYDNIAAVVVTTAGADEITCTVSAIPLEVLAEITGQLYDETTGTYIECEKKTKYYALGYKTKKLDGTYVYVWRLKGTFAIPDATHTTENDGTDANGDEITFTGISTTYAFKKTGRVKAINVDGGQEKADVSAFFETVVTPDTLKAKTF